jgi:glucosamine--fructose-6-phosphate aminotransferase (isomerizing)
MCGIVGYVGPRKAAGVLLGGLKRLEYRGYDSAGIAVSDGGVLGIYKKKGKVQELKSIVPEGLGGSMGIGHTRWATHGGVTDANAHPHADASGKVAIVHNGIIENYSQLKDKLAKDGVVFKSETDSEVIAHLIALHYAGDLERAVKAVLPLLKGTYGIAAIHADEPGVIVGARNGSPLVVGIGNDEMFLASDVTAMVAYTRQVIYIEDGEVVRVTREGYATTDQGNREVDKRIDEVTWELKAMDHEGYATYMEKEIFEQPESILRCMQGRIDMENATPKLGGLNLSSKELRSVQHVKIIAAGTSWHAGLVGAHMLESVARVPAAAELASEIRYRNPVVEPETLYFAVSQSGETADTLYAMRELKRKGSTVLGICNVVGATIPRESDGGVYIHSGPEIAVASTKAFTSQLMALSLFAVLMARVRDLSFNAGRRILSALQAVPAQMKVVLEQKDRIRELAHKYCKAKDFLFLGRGPLYPVALEGALKLKEVSYIHAEGYASGEIKHGPIALVDGGTPSFFLVPDDFLREKVHSNMKEIKARGGPVIALAVEGDEESARIADDVIYVPKADPFAYPFLMVAPLQLFSYYCAAELGRDVDQPRNLAKSVTVE